MIPIGQRIKIIADLTNCEDSQTVVGMTGTITYHRTDRHTHPDHVYGVRIDGLVNPDYMFLPEEIEAIESSYKDLDKIQLNFAEEE